MTTARWLVLWVACGVGCGGEGFEVARPAEDAVRAEVGGEVEGDAHATADADAQAEADAQADANAQGDAEADAQAADADDGALVVDSAPGPDSAPGSDSGSGSDSGLESCDGPVVTCFPDKDGDGYAGLGASVLACSCPPGTTSRSPLVVVDCHDEDPAVKPTAQAFHATAYCVAGTSCATKSFDYDCSGAVEMKLPALFGGCGPFANGCLGAGWSGAVPGCGGSGSYVSCKKGLLACETVTSVIEQTCR